MINATNFLYNSRSLNAINYCPVSSLIDTQFDGILGYPIDLFDQKLYSSLRQPSDKITDSTYSEDYFRCTSTFMQSNNHGGTIRTCSTLGQCPLQSENIKSMTENTSWPALHSLCHLRQALHDPDATVNVFVLGGSVTTGTLTYGCCCDATLDAKCRSFSSIKPAWCGAPDVSPPLCRWSKYFERYIKSKSMGQANVYNLAHGGWNSAYMASNFVWQFESTGVTSLSKNDIVFIDHSQNDALTCTNTAFRQQGLIDGLAHLVRAIYSKSIPESWPTIILLEFWPYGNNRQSESSLKYDYGIAYSKIAQLYQIPIWSYRKFAWAKFVDEKQSNMASTFRFTVTHPPWYIHLLYADLIASVFEQELKSCMQEKRGGINKSITRSPRDMYLKSFDKLKGIVSSSTAMCLDVDNTFIFQVPDFNKTSDGKFIPPKMNFTSEPLDAWYFIEERGGKWGWVTNKQNKIPSVNFPTGGMFGNHSYSSSIKFNILMKNVESKLLLRIHYLRTYLDAGAVDVFLCGHFIVTLDALWRDYLYYHYSYPDLFLYTIPSEIMKNCMKDEMSFLEFKHILIPDEPLPLVGEEMQQIRSHNSHAYGDARKDMKFKIIRLEICQTD